MITYQRLNLYKKILFTLSFTIAVIFFLPCTNAQNPEKISPFKNLISFTTQNSAKLEVTFNETPSSSTKFAVKIMDDKSTIKMQYTGDRRLVLLQTSFK